MNGFGARRLKLATLAATAVAAVVGGVAHASAEGPQQWVWLASGCAGLSDDGGLTSTVQVCPEGNGNYDVYGVDAAGQWVYSYQIVTADWSMPDEPPQSSPFPADSSGDWEQSMSTGATPTTATWLDVALDAALANSYGQPSCDQVIGDICYVS